MTDAPRKRRWPKFLAGFAIVVALAAWWVDRQLEPTRLARTVLAMAGESQGLALAFDGQPEYALRPEPRLVLPNLVARQPGAAAPLLTAERAEVSLPWDTLWGDGPLVVTRIALQAPALDLAALESWLASRPDEGPAELPTLTRGLHITGGRVIGDGWRLEALSLDLPTLAPGAPARAELAGELGYGDWRLLFAGPLSLDRAGLATPFAFEGAGKLAGPELDARWTASLKGQADLSGDTTSFGFDAFSLDGDTPLPSLQATGHLRLGEPAELAFTGELASWPEAWPTLPAPLSESDSPLGFLLTYAGPGDFSAPFSLDARRDEARLEAHAAIAPLQAWIDSPERSLLPPLQGRLSVPRLEVEGYRFEGVDIELTDSDDGAGDPE